MLKGVLPVCTILLAIVEITLSQEVERRSPHDRNTFSRYANSRFPFFTVDLAQLRDKHRLGGGKRNALGPVTNIETTDALVDAQAPQDIAQAFGLLSARRVGNMDVLTEEVLGYDDVPYTATGQQSLLAAEKRSDIRKRIHTCAFMRRMGVPIGLCFNNLRRISEDQKANAPGPQPEPARNPYDYLERQWQGHTMLGGGVGRR